MKATTSATSPVAPACASRWTMAAALRLMHTEPGHPWTVPELARTISMSRSAFAARFKALVGATPLDHLTEWRMVRAAGVVRGGRHLKLAAGAGGGGGPARRPVP